MTLSIKAFIIMAIFATLSINNTKYKWHSAKWISYHYADYINLFWVSLCCMSSCWVSWHPMNVILNFFKVQTLTKKKMIQQKKIWNKVFWVHIHNIYYNLSLRCGGVIMLSVFMLSVIMLSVIFWVSLCWITLISPLCYVSLCWVSWRHFCIIVVQTLWALLLLM